MAVPPANLNFFSALHAGATVSARGNRWVANLAFPASPLRDAGAFLTNYYARALVAPTNGLVPVIAAGSTALRLQGSVPLADRTAYPETWVDLYRADPEGIELGRSLFLPELPDGFVQGAMFLGSFRDNGPLDRDSTDGVFDLDLSGLGLVEVLVTITANYVSAWVGGEAPVLTSPFSLPVAVSGGGTGELRFTSIALTAGGVRMEWSGGGELQAAPALGATWQTVPGASSPYVVPASGGQRLFRLKR
jgi:hypothetical protein